MMKNKQDLSRRDFIRNSVMAGGAVLLSGVLPSHAQTPIFSAAENSDSPEADELLRGVSDIHLHAAPDSKARLGNELEFTRAHVMPATNPCCSSPTISVVMTGLI